MQLKGLAFKMVPRKGPFWQNLDVPSIEAHLFTEMPMASKEPAAGFRWRGLQDSTVYYDEDSRRLVMSNYRNLFFTAAEYHIYTVRDLPRGLKVLDRMEVVIPRNVIPMDPNMLYRMGLVYLEAGQAEKGKGFLATLVKDVSARRDEYLKEQLSQFNPLVVLFYSQIELGMFTEADDLLKVMGSAYASQQGIQQAIQQLQMQLTARRAAASADTMTKK
jgi:hypothetical protein